MRSSLGLTLLCAVTLGLVPGVVPAAPAAASSAALQEIEAVSPEIAARIQPSEGLLEPVSAATRPLPAAPVEALVAAVTAVGTQLGYTLDPGPAIRGAGLPDAVAGRTANLLNDISACTAVTKAKYAAIPPSERANVIKTGGGLDPAEFSEIGTCAQRMWAGTGELELALPAAAPGSCTPLGNVSLDIWPVLRFDGTCKATSYHNDYALVVDVGGNDVHANSAGSNMLDLNFSPAGSAVTGVRGTGPARGCQRAIPGLAAADCTPAAAVLLDLSGKDTYGVKQTPDHDAGCTNDPVIRRMVTGGVGFLGVGILRDVTGNDTYTGKTVSLGAGHVFGVGLLSDGAGNDTYTAVRNSEGFALVGGFGLLRDQDGNDKYDFYMPAPIDPSAPNQAEGAGGVRDDEGEGLCDRIPRFTQGTANVLVGTIGLLIEDTGSDTYHGAFVTEFTAPGQVPSTRAGSLGFGNNQGTAAFLDRTGTDTYTVDNERTDRPRRADHTTIAPGSEATSAGGGQAAFIDQ